MDEDAVEAIHRPVTASHHSTRKQPDLVVTAQTFSSRHVLIMVNVNMDSLGPVMERRFQDEDEYPWKIVILSSNVLARLNGLQMCTKLRKLDLSDNQIKTLPNKSFWSRLTNLTTLLLHNNKIDSIHTLQSLSALPELRILTVYGNVVEHHPAYRHMLVNLNIKLILLDFFLVSDQELIEDVKFPPKYAPFSPNHELILPRYNQLSEADHRRLYAYELRYVRQKHTALSPILRIQSWWRGVLVRNTMLVYQRAANTIQIAYRRHAAQRQQRQKQESLAQVMKQSARVIYVARSSELVITVFTRLVQRVESKLNVRAADPLDARMLLLSPPDPVIDFPILRSLPRSRSLADHEKLHYLRLGRRFTTAEHRLLNNTRRHMSVGRMSQALKQRVASALASPSSSRRSCSMIKFVSPSTAFHTELLQNIHLYNQGVNTMNDTTDGPGGPSEPDPERRERHARRRRCRRALTIYPAGLVALIAAAVKIQSAWRAFRARSGVQPSIGNCLLVWRGTRTVVRWWKQYLFEQRLLMLAGLLRYGQSIDSRHLFVRADAFDLLQAAPSPFVKSGLFPEHSTVVDVEDHTYPSAAAIANSRLVRPPAFRSAALGPTPSHFPGVDSLVRDDAALDADSAVTVYNPNDTGTLRPVSAGGAGMVEKKKRVASPISQDDFQLRVYTSERSGPRPLPLPVWIFMSWSDHKEGTPTLLPLTVDAPPSGKLRRADLTLVPFCAGFVACIFV